MDLLTLLRSPPVLARGILAHRYLKNTLLLPSEKAAAARFAERPEIDDDIATKLREIEATFIDGYDPSAFVRELRPLQALETNLRNKLLDAVKRAYIERFRPEERLDKYRRATAAFSTALNAWHAEVAASGVGAASAPLWAALGQSAEVLHDVLEDRELSTRWIP